MGASVVACACWVSEAGWMPSGSHAAENRRSQQNLSTPVRTASHQEIALAHARAQAVASLKFRLTEGTVSENPLQNITQTHVNTPVHVGRVEGSQDAVVALVLVQVSVWAAVPVNPAAQDTVHLAPGSAVAQLPVWPLPSTSGGHLGWTAVGRRGFGVFCVVGIHCGRVGCGMQWRGRAAAVGADHVRGGD